MQARSVFVVIALILVSSTPAVAQVRYGRRSCADAGRENLFGHLHERIRAARF